MHGWLLFSPNLYRFTLPMLTLARWLSLFLTLYNLKLFVWQGVGSFTVRMKYLDGYNMGISIRKHIVSLC